ncbi:ABC transporter ATP-binding protein [Mesorhizobium sp. WSM1497]|nr:ABC transporter ATP-binding protein [Mesorhizobium sp. WSM1497]
MTSMLVTESLTKRFGDVVANDSVSLEIRSGEIHCLFGENGAGKSTLAECLYGFLQPDEGRILIDGSSTKLTSPAAAIAHGIGMVHQHFVLVEPLTVLENIMVGTGDTPFLLNPEATRGKLRSLCARYQISVPLDVPVRQLSVGEQQWVEILKALYRDVRLLILDEPTAVLTPQESERLFEVLFRMRSEGLAIVIITHKLNEVMKSDRVSVLRKGRKIATVESASTSAEKLTAMMVGRALSVQKNLEKGGGGEDLLRITNLDSPNDRGDGGLKNVSLTLRRGEILAIAGVAGNGQSELFETLIGVRKPRQGRIELNGEDITGLAPREIIAKGVGYVPDDRFQDGLVPQFSIAENLILGRHRSSEFSRAPFLNAKAIDQFAEQCFAEYKIKANSINVLTELLSGGNAQKIILAREFLEGRECILCNQPTRGLDVGIIEYVHEQLLRKRREGIGILMATEDLDDIFNLSDRIAVIFGGRIMDILETSQTTVEQVGYLMAGRKADAA